MTLEAPFESHPTATMSYNSQSVHTGTIWESRFRAKTCEPDEKAELMNIAGYIAVARGEKNRYLPSESRRQT